MAQLCALCGRGKQVGNLVSHSNRKTKRWFRVNLQTKKIDGKKKKICPSCLKTLSKSAK